MPESPNQTPLSEPGNNSPEPACLALRWSRALVDGLVAGGVRRLVLSPGSRSTPLVLAAEQCDELQLIPIVDERSAAFFALGLARADSRPAALLATSGSAPAHWHPAVIEACEWGIPLVLLSADRPPALIGWGTNQTTHQRQLFHDHLRAFHDPGLPDPKGCGRIHALGRRAAASSRWPNPGPVHINLPFAEPLVPAADCLATPADPRLPAITPPAPAAATDDALSQATELIARGRGLILCGPMDQPNDILPPLCTLAHHLGAPVLADPLSGLRFGSPAELPLVSRYDTLLRHPKLAARLRPDWVLQLGRPPVSRILQEWLAGIPMLAADPHHRWADPGGNWHIPIFADPATLCAQLARAQPVRTDRQWIQPWLRAEQRCTLLTTGHLDRAGWFEGQLIPSLLSLLPAHARLLLGNSLPVRQLDTWSGRHPRALQVFGNRGVSGIDGQVSTLAGIAAQGGGPAFGLIGDLSLLHDLGGLQLARRCPLTLLVVNNGGGRIFDYLPQQGLPGLQAHWRTPTGLEPERMAHAFDIDYHTVTDPSSLEDALNKRPARSRSQLLEVVVDAALSQRETEAYWQTIAQDPLLADIAQEIP